MTAQVCVPTGDQCYDCSDYAGAFACLDKIRISDMAVATPLELADAIESECTNVLIAADFIPCNGDPYTQAINVSDLISSAAVTSPIAATFWTPIDLGDSYGGCWRRFNTDLTITRVDFPDFFTVAGIAGDVYTISGMEGKMAMGSGEGYCNNNEVTGDADGKFTIGTENIPRFNITVNDPGHGHTATIGVDREGSNGTLTPSFEVDSGKKGFGTGLPVSSNHTGLTVEPVVGDGGNGSPVAIESKPWSVCGSWYIKLSNDCV